MSGSGRTAPIPIPQIQGRGSLSPYEGKSVTTTGVVTALQKSTSAPGFYLQDAKGDGDAATSDGLFVSTAKAGAGLLKTLTPGSVVQVSGQVKEQHQLTTIVATQRGLKPLSVLAPNAEAKLPAATELKVPSTLASRQTYLEAREGMLATLPDALVLAPSTQYSVYTAANEKTHGVARDFGLKADPRHLKISGRIGPSRPQLGTGDRVEGVHGVLSFAYGDFELQQTRHYKQIKRGPQPPLRWGDVDGDDKIGAGDIKRIKAASGKPASGPLDPADLNADGKISRSDVTLAQKRAKLGTGAPAFSVTTMNAKDFFDDVDAPPPIDDEVPSKNEYQAKLARVSSAIRQKLGLPDMIAMQEVENTRVLDDLIARPELKALGYKYALLPTNGHRSINPALLYRGDRVNVTDVRQVQKHVSLEQSAVAGTGEEAKGPLFAREPLLVDVSVGKGEQTQDLTLVVNHLISKFSPHGTPTDPIRINQAKFLNSLVKDLRAAHPERELIVLGDMNDTPDSKAMKALRGPAKNPALVDVISQHVPQAERYSYNYHGQSQLIDHILTTPGLAARVEDAGVRHYNADVPANHEYGTGPNRASDHDNPYVMFAFGTAPAKDAAKGAAELAAAGTPAARAS